MKQKLAVTILITVLAMLLTLPVLNMGCQERGEELPSPPPMDLAATLVPNMPLDVYVFSKQESPTKIPAELVDATQDIDVESLAVWGSFEEHDYAIGIGLILASESDASYVYDRIVPDKEGWKMLAERNIYYIQGSGVTAEALKTAISNNDFKCYDDSEALRALQLLPDNATTRLAGVALAKPSKELIDSIIEAGDIRLTDRQMGQIHTFLRWTNLKVVAGGLYSRQQIDVAEIAEVIDRDGSLSELDLGLLVLVKSGLPGFIVEFAAERYIKDNKFTEVEIGGVTLYRDTWDTRYGEEVTVFIRIVGNHLFAAVSGQESYAQTLITNIQIK